MPPSRLPITRIALIILAVAALIVGGLWYIGWKAKQPDAQTAPETEGLGAQLFDEVQKPVVEDLPSTNPFTTETNPFKSYKNPFGE